MQVGHVKNLTGSNETFGVRVYLTAAAQVTGSCGGCLASACATAAV